MAIETIKVPDIGGSENVDVIEVCVKAGDVISEEDSLLVLESDKASMDIPSPMAGKVVKVLVKEGDQVSEGAAIFEIELDSNSAGASDDGEDKQTGKGSTTSKAEPSQNSSAASDDGDAASDQEMPVSVPDIGGSENVDVIEICVKVGDEIAEGDSLIVLESDKASMEVPSPAAGKVLSISIKEGDKVSKGDPVAVLSVSGGAKTDSGEATGKGANSVQESKSTESTPVEVDLQVPDIGGSENVNVIEVSVAVGDEVGEGDTLIVLESDKASMEIPSSHGGKITRITVKEGDKVSMGDIIGAVQTAGGGTSASSDETSTPSSDAATAQPASAPTQSSGSRPSAVDTPAPKPSKDVYAGPAVRKLARQLGVDLGEVPATGPRGRMTKDDVKTFVKGVMSNRSQGGSIGTGTGIPAIPEVDFAQFGEVELVKMSKIKKLTAANMVRNWLNVPHVTQFDDVDISEMEDFRKSMKADAEKAGVKLTPLPFLLKACAAALRAEPRFNVSMHADGEHVVQKKYVHIGMAVDTPNGLVVPVIRDVDKKGLYQLAAEATELAGKARDGKLMAKDMQGGCFTISSLGAIGGTGFTPIVNAPEVSILGVSRADIKPVWDGKEFVPRLMLPLCLSYDHRAINGADAGRFLTYLSGLLKDVRRLLL